MAASDKKKYTRMDNMLQHINSNFITVSKADVCKVQPILKFVIDTVITGLQEYPLFKILFTDVLYGGSFYDGLKVGKPEEFDIDFRLALPNLVKAQLEMSNEPGFVKCKMTNWDIFQKSDIFIKHKGLETFKDSDNYLLVDQVLRWVKSMINKFLNTYKENNQIRIPYNGKPVEIKLTESGPAQTLLISYGGITLDVDLVIVFRFSEKDWPAPPFKKLPVECKQKREFMIVPKAPKSNAPDRNRCWRMSFQEQERVLLNGINTCKTALRIMKKMRDKLDHKSISSYFIKTVFLHEVEVQPRDFWCNSLSFVLMHMLNKYKTYLDNRKIPYYWNKNNDLLQGIDPITIDNFKNCIKKIIDSVDRNYVDNPYKIAEYISTSDEKKLLEAAGFVPPSPVTQTLVKCSGSNPVELASSVNVVDNSAVKTENDKMIISLLKGINSSISILQTDMKSALKKLSDLDQTVQDLKNDNVNLRSMAEGFVNQDKFTDKLKQQEAETANMQEQVEYLNKTVEILKNYN